MGKKPQKTKEISVAIAEATSSVIDVTEQQEFQVLQPQQGPRKRGRPRKIIVEMGEKSGGEKKVSQQEKMLEQEEEAYYSIEAQAQGQGMEIIRSIEEEKGKGNNNNNKEEEEKNEGSSQACMSITSSVKKQEQGLVPSRSRARRKSKPRKSS